jgi:hypothetical protein
LIFFVREAWPSPTTGTQLTEGRVSEESRLVLTSEMTDTGVIFGDGIEDDALRFGWGQKVQLDVAPQSLMWVA